MKNQMTRSLLKSSFFLALLFGYFSAFSQQVDTTYHNKYGMKCDADTAHFIRTSTAQGERLFIKEYFTSNQLVRSEGWEIQSSRRNQKDGVWKHFYENGSPKTETNYDNGVRTGTSKEWFENGQQEAIWNHGQGNTTLQSSWSPTGEAMVVAGEGIYEDHYTGGEKHYRGPIKAGKQYGEWQGWFVDGTLMYKAQIENGFIVGKEEIWDNNGQKIYEGVHGDQVERTYWSKEGEETHHVITGAETKATNWFGLGSIDPFPLNMPEVRMAIGYPKKARKQGIEGRVYVMVILDEKGDILLAKIANPTHEIFQKAIMKHIYGLEFTPGIVSGKYVKVRVNAPFRFKLTD
jgi:TonB family protein